MRPAESANAGLRAQTGRGENVTAKGDDGTEFAGHGITADTPAKFMVSQVLPPGRCWEVSRSRRMTAAAAAERAMVLFFDGRLARSGRATHVITSEMIMDIFCDPTQISRRYGPHIADLRRLFVFHGLRCGKVEDFAALVAALEESRALRWTCLPCSGIFASRTAGGPRRLSC